MMKDFLGQDNFMKGITSYLNKYKFGNAVTADLWNALSEVGQRSNITLSESMIALFNLHLILFISTSSKLVKNDPIMLLCTSSKKTITLF